MTKITIYKSNEGNYTRFTCEGHSGFDYDGHDIVCASISILVINAVNSMEELAGEEMDYTARNGFVDCKFRHSISNESKLLMDSMILGLQTIAEQYGKKYLRLKFKEV